jgi:uncharacterized membrane protein
MSSKTFAVCLLLFFFIQFQCRVVQGAYQLEYMIEVNADGSALWTVEQRGTDIQTSLDRFVENMSWLLNSAQIRTQREMAVTNFGMNVNVSGSYKVVEYRCQWGNFSKAVGSEIEIGDVFDVQNFFAYLYGDGTVIFRYPQNYTIAGVSPSPNEQDSSKQMLEWYGIDEFKTGEPNIILQARSTTSGFFDAVSRDLIIVLILVALVGGGAFSFYYFRLVKRRKKEYPEPGKPEAQKQLRIEDDEEKVINLLRAAGGTLYQSTITEECRFSRAKTSKLLKIMEDKGRIKREDKGRERVVTLSEKIDG